MIRLLIATLVLACPFVVQAQDLPSVPALDTVIKPAEAEMQFGEWFPKTIVIRNTPTESRASVLLHRWNKVERVLSPNPSHKDNIRIDNLFASAQEYRVFRDAMGALMVAMALETQNQQLTRLIDEYQEEIDLLDSGIDGITNRITRIDEQIAAAQEEDAEADVTVLQAQAKSLATEKEAKESEKAAIEAGQAPFVAQRTAVRTAMGPLN